MRSDALVLLQFSCADNTEILITALSKYLSRPRRKVEGNAHFVNKYNGQVCFDVNRRAVMFSANYEVFRSSNEHQGITNTRGQVHAHNACSFFTASTRNQDLLFIRHCRALNERHL